METGVTQKGQVTIPKDVREALGLRPGSKVRIEADGAGGARITPARPLEGRFTRFVGAARRNDGLSTDEYMRLMREDDPS